MRFKTKNGVLVDNLRFELNRMNFKYSKEKAINTDLSDKMFEMINKSQETEMLLKRVLNELTERNEELKQLKEENIKLKHENLDQKQLLEIKENQRRKSAGKVGALTKEIEKLKDEKIGQNEIIKSLNKDNHNLKGLVKSNKDARAYLRGKSEHER